MVNVVTETFFLPKEASRKSWSIPAEMYNLYHALKARCTVGHVFVPIRSMQFMAVLVRMRSYLSTANPMLLLKVRVAD